jgi:uncharacterized protein (DUF1800 family)/5-hydroxyisourate hydrolase-like protein (transthyretin family)
MSANEPGDGRAARRPGKARPALAGLAIALCLLCGVPAAFAATADVLVRLTDYATTQPIADLNVAIWEVLPSGQREYRASGLTDGAGEAAFQIAGLEAGRTFVVRTKPFQELIERTVPGPGMMDIEAGTLRVRLVHGVTDEPLAEVPATVFAVGDGDTLTRLGAFTTDAEGRLILDPPVPGPEFYRLRATSPVDGTLKYGRAVAAPGRYRVRIGNAPVTVRLVDHLTGLPMPGRSIQVQRVQTDGSWEWQRAETTDDDGRVVLDLDGLAEGQRYVVRAQPFVQWIDREVAKPGPIEMQAGSLTVQLVDQEQNAPLPGREVVLQRKLPNGELVWLAQGITGAGGRVRFDPAELPSEDTVYMLAANNPFGDGKRHLSMPITAPGTMTFPLLQASPASIDLTAPGANVLAAGGVVYAGTHGFTLQGYALDDREIRDVQVELRGPRGEIELVTAQYDPDSTHWIVHQAPAWFAVGDTVTVRVRARDGFYNAVSRTVTVQVIDDVDPPTVRITGPTNDLPLHDRGIVVRGTAADETEIASLTATLVSASGEAMAERPVAIEPGTGRWAVALTAEALAGLTSATLRMRATDSSGNLRLRGYDLVISPTANALQHLLARTSFGETAAALEEALQLGYTAYLERQLDPASIDDSALEARLADEPLENLVDLRGHQLLRATYSERQLQEWMTWFWENHFNTDYNRHNVLEWEIAENQAFREHALGRFRDLLEISARSPAMLYFLDGVRNRFRDPNENYARELLELHTLGLGGGYTQADIDAAARAFTGWQELDGAFHFEVADHDKGPKTVLGTTLAGSGLEEGEQVLDLVAAHPSTARRVCSKLIMALLIDDPPGGLLTGCTAVFQANADAPDQIARTVAAIVDTPGFRGAVHRHAKLKTPIRFLTGLTRTLGAEATGRQLAADLVTIGQLPFAMPIPTGYPVRAEDWASSDLLMSRLALIGRMLETRPDNDQLHLDVASLLDDPELVLTAEGIAGHLLMRLQNEDFTQEDLDAALAVLSEDGAVQFDMHSAAADARLTRLLRTLLSMPRYHLY